MSVQDQWFRSISSAKDHHLIHGYARNYGLLYIPAEIAQQCITYLSIFRWSVKTTKLQEIINGNTRLISKPIAILQHDLMFHCRLQVHETEQKDKFLTFAIGINDAEGNPNRYKHIVFRYDVYCQDNKSHTKILHWYEVETIQSDQEYPNIIMCENALLLISDINRFDKLEFFVNVEILLIVSMNDCRVFDAYYYSFNRLDSSIHFEWNVNALTLSKMNQCHVGQLFVSPKFGNDHFCMIVGPKGMGSVTNKLVFGLKLLKMPRNINHMELQIGFCVKRNQYNSVVKTTKPIFSYQYNIITDDFGKWDNNPKCLSFMVVVKITKLGNIRRSKWKMFGVNSKSSDKKDCILL